MKLLYLARRFPKLSETFVYNEVAGHAARGHDVKVLSILPPEMVTRDRQGELGRLVHQVPRVPLRLRPVPDRDELRIPEERLTRRLYAMVAARWALRGPLCAWRPDVIHAHFANLPTLLAAEISHLLGGVPYTFMAHAADYMLNMSDDLLRLRVMHADAAFVISDAARADVLARARLEGAQADKVSVIRASMRPLAAQASEATPGKGFSVVSVARLVPMKGVDTALKGFAELRRRVPNARYHVVGDGPERGRLEALARDLDLNGSVRFFGSVDNDRAQKLIAGSDVALLPCRRDADGNMDGIPVFMMEAGALGVPVVSTATSGVPELVQHERGGLLVDPEDHAAVAEALGRLAGEAGLRERLGAGLRDRVVGEFAIERQLDRLEEHWDDLTAGVPR